MSPHQSSSPSSTTSPFRKNRSTVQELTPFLSDTSLDQSPDLSVSDPDSDIENGVSQRFPFPAAEDEYLLTSTPKRSWRIPFLRRLIYRTRRLSRGAFEKSIPGRRPSLLRTTLRLIAILLMVLGVLNLITALIGLALSFFPEEVSFSRYDASSRLPQNLRHWPTDTTANIHPIACHSHNDYWRKEPLFSALSVGCESVEADVWLFNDDLYVGHSAASLTKERTLRSLYINPLLELLDKQNPTTDLHPSLDKPRNGVFDTDPEQSLVLLIDFKTEGEVLWTHVSDQLDPLRKKHYLTHFNGTDLVNGPITVVVTGNAPWNRVVANPTYRDMFFDAPLDLMVGATDVDATPEVTDLSHLSANPNGTTMHRFRSTNDDSDTPAATEGQGRSGAAPLNPNVYSPANSYYASVSFKAAVLGFPVPIQYPWRSTLTDKQMALIRAQIEGAHKRGLKVRYWGVPSWPKGLRNYLWRVLVREGIDYLNVDELREAKEGTWGRPWEKGVGGWRGHGWFGGKAS